METVSIIFNIINFLISVLAIGISIWSVYMTSKKSAQIDYKKSLYDNILRNDLQNELPQIIEKTFNFNDRQADTIKFEEFIGGLRKKILVFKYIDIDFYTEMNQILIKLDELLVIISTRKEGFEEKYEKITELTTNLYKNIESYLFK